jgi:hypothetical protein
MIVSGFVGLALLGSIAVFVAWRHDPWSLMRLTIPTERVTVFDSVTPRNPALIVREDVVQIGLFRKGSCVGCDTAWPSPADKRNLAHYYDVHTIRDPVARKRILTLLAPFHGYGGSKTDLEFARRHGFALMGSRKQIACNARAKGDFIVLDWGTQPEENDITILTPACATREVDAALARILHAFEIAAEATATTQDPRSRFSLDAFRR